ncbi:hypothetical protein BZA77DRAFT_357055 [Pyronema omphalodes]|nr:hypothetical protein BZA77DRAFT_357055 [Pyronema omphalodes]
MVPATSSQNTGLNNDTTATGSNTVTVHMVNHVSASNAASNEATLITNTDATPVAHKTVGNVRTPSSSGNHLGNDTAEPMKIEAIGTMPNDPSYSMNLWLSEGHKDDGVKFYRA